MSCSKLTVSTGGDVGGGGVGSGSLTPANQPARDADGSSIGKLRSDRKSMEYSLYDTGTAPGGKEATSGPLRRELMHVHFINSLRNRNPGAMHVGVPTVDAAGAAKMIQPVSEGKDTLEDMMIRTPEVSSGGREERARVGESEGESVRER